MIEYDHLGIKNCLFHNYQPRTEDRISKGRRVFNAITGIGIRKKGVSMAACPVFYWSIIVLIVTYGCELWVLSSVEIEELRKLQRFIGRKCQRYPKRSPNFSAYPGWMSLDRVVQVKKLMFFRTIIIMEDDDIYKRILVARANQFCDDIESSMRNEMCSPIYDIMSTSIKVDMFDTCMVRTGCYFSKAVWRKMVRRYGYRRE